MDLNDPVDQDRTHGPLDVMLEVHVVRIWAHAFLGRKVSQCYQRWRDDK